MVQARLPGIPSEAETWARWSTATYQTLERETGYATGWRPVGSVRVAASDDRWAELRRLVTTARSFGFESA